MERTNKRRGLAAIVGVVAAAALVAFTPTQEGTILKTYKDIGGVLTYCTGATEDAQWGRTYTRDECKAQLDRDLARHAEGVMACVHVPMTDGQKIAHIDAAFNIGVTAWCGSSMARKTNAGDARGGCEALLLWDKVNGRAILGLTRRRMAERDICVRGLP